MADSTIEKKTLENGIRELASLVHDMESEGVEKLSEEQKETLRKLGRIYMETHSGWSMTKETFGEHLAQIDREIMEFGRLEARELMEEYSLNPAMKVSDGIGKILTDLDAVARSRLAEQNPDPGAVPGWDKIKDDLRKIMEELDDPRAYTGAAFLKNALRKLDKNDPLEPVTEEERKAIEAAGGPEEARKLVKRMEDAGWVVSKLDEKTRKKLIEIDALDPRHIIGITDPVPEPVNEPYDPGKPIGDLNDPFNKKIDDSFVYNGVGYLKRILDKLDKKESLTDEEKETLQKVGEINARKIVKKMDDNNWNPDCLTEDEKEGARWAHHIDPANRYYEMNAKVAVASPALEASIAAQPALKIPGMAA